MKYILLISILLLTFSDLTIAQSSGHRPTPERFKERKAEIEKLKKEFIGTRINLTDEQAPKFWKVYDKYIEEKFRIKKQLGKLQRSGFSMAATDEELNKSIDKMFELRTKELDLDKKSKAEFLKVLNIRQLAELYRSEKEFFREILRKFRGKRMKDE